MLKKVLALALAGAMVLGSMSLTAFAADPTVERSVAIGGLDEGDTVKFYKVLEWADTTKEAEDNHAVSGWYWAAPWSSAFTELAADGKSNKKLFDAVDASTMKLVLTDSLANDIAQVLNAYTATPLDGQIGTAPNVVTYATSYANGVATLAITPDQVDDFTNYDGLYMAIITPKDQDTVYNPVFVHIDSSTKKDQFNIVESSASYMNASKDDEGNVIGGAAKKSKINLDKSSKNDNDYTDSVNETKPNPVDSGDTTKPYDKLTFTVDTTIPGYGESFDEPAFNLTDKLNTMKLVYPGAASGTHTEFAADGTEVTVTDTYAGSIKVKVGDDEYVVDTLNSGTKFENDVFTLTPQSNQYKIEFKPAFLKTIHVPTAVKVTYDAIIQPGANDTVVKEKNTVELEFSHDPSTENSSKPGGDKNYKKDITNHYTFSIDANNLVGPTGKRPGESGSELIKVAVDKSGNPIYDKTTWSNVGEPETTGVKSPLAGADFNLYASNADGTVNKNKIVGKATSDSAGRINFTGLDAGKYWLEETKAPAGFVKQSGEFPILIEATMQEKTITEYTTDGETWISEEDYNKLSEDAKKAYQSYTYKTEELLTSKVTYGGNTTSYTFDHIHESTNDDIDWKVPTSVELPSSIPNTQGVELPSTGGIGTTIFYAGGAILVLLAGVLLVSKRRIA